MDKTKDKSALPPDIAKMSFEDALTELERLVRQLEDGKAGLDAALGAYERGVLLKRLCEARLREAQARIEKISVDENQGLSLSPLNV